MTSSWYWKARPELEARAERNRLPDGDFDSLELLVALLWAVIFGNAIAIPLLVPVFGGNHGARRYRWLLDFVHRDRAPICCVLALQRQLFLSRSLRCGDGNAAGAPRHGFPAGDMVARRTAVLWIFPAIRIPLVPKTLRCRRAHHNAVRQFHSKGVHGARARTGVLPFLSLAERYAEGARRRRINRHVAPTRGTARSRR
jgi:hypothetical protein